MISGLALAGSGLGVKEYTEMAVKSARFIQTHLLQSEVKEPFFFSAVTVRVIRSRAIFLVTSDSAARLPLFLRLRDNGSKPKIVMLSLIFVIMFARKFCH